MSAVTMPVMMLKSTSGLMLVWLSIALLSGCHESSADAVANALPNATLVEPDSESSPEGVDIAALRRDLHESIAEHQIFNYRQLWEALSQTDADPDRPGYVRLFYTGWSRAADDHGSGQSQWNREHVWPKSRGDFGTRPGPGTDLHLVRPTDVSVNNARSNLSFDRGGELYIDGDGATGCRRDSDSWEPRAEVRGDVARMMFYCAIRYEPGDVVDLELVESIQGRSDKAPELGVLSTLLSWHAADPPDAWERQRNDRIELVQGNRNPFIDRPELATTIWKPARNEGPAAGPARNNF